MLVRFIAAGLIVLGVLDAGLAGGRDLVNRQPIHFSRLALPAVSLMAGIVILIKAPDVAEWISDKLDI